MRCDDVELALSSEEQERPEVREHLASCPQCREYAASVSELLAAVMLPAPSSSEREALTRVPAGVEAQWHRRQGARVIWWRYALAAAAGALLMVGIQAMLQSLSVEAPSSPPLTTPASVAGGSDPRELASALATIDWESDDQLPSEEAAFFEISWPSTSEGETR